MKKALRDWRLLIGVIAIAVMAIYFTTAGGTFFVNGKAVPANQGQPFSKSGVTYVPLEPIVKGMGDSYSFVGKYDKATITKKGKVFKVTTGKSVAIAGNKVVPLTTKLVGSGNKKVKVPAGHRAIRINNVLYVPTEFVQTILGYPVTVKGNTIYIGVVPTTQVPQPTQPTEPSQPSTPVPTQPTDKYAPPAGWVAPTVNTTATDDKARNIQVLSDQLGLYKTSNYDAIFNPYRQADGPASILVFSDPSSVYDVHIQIDVWVNSNDINYNKTPYLAKELFRFYQVSGVYDIIRGGFMGENVTSKMNRILTYGNRQVKIVGVGDSVAIYISKAGQPLGM